LEGIDPISACQQDLNLDGRFFPGNDWQVKNQIKIQASKKINIAQNRRTTIEESPYNHHNFDSDYIIQAGERISILPGFSINSPFRLSSGKYLNFFPTGEDNKVSFRIGPCIPFIDDCGFNHENSSVKPLENDGSIRNHSARAVGNIMGVPNDIIQTIPNPNNGLFDIKVAENLSLEQIAIFSSTGQVIWHTSNSIEIKNTLKIDLGTQTKGLYFLKAMTSNGTILSSQFIVE
jgi:hypothetical protein